MRTILLDGESKTGKTSVTKAVAEGLSLDLSVKVADAGAFFRRITAAMLDTVGVERAYNMNQSAISEAVDEVLADGTPFNDDYPWGDLERSAVGGLVSVLAQLPSTQAAGEQWFSSTVEQTQDIGSDVLVLNARNPRERLRGHPIGLAMELLVRCDPEVAGRRTLGANGVSNPITEDLREATDNVLRRRAYDRNRDVHPFTDPAHTVPFVLGVSDPRIVLNDAWIAPGDLPHPIDFDTTHMPIGEMRTGVLSLARCALDLVE